LLNTSGIPSNGLSHHVATSDLSRFDPAVQKALQKLQLLRDGISIEPIIKKIADWPSPLEQEVYLAFISLRLSRRIPPKVLLTEQYPVTGNGKVYLVDFKLSLADEMFPNEPPFVALIECDSYIYHDRTPEQFDEERERIIELQRYGGGKVYPFTGKKLRKGVAKCVLECVVDLQRDLLARREMLMRAFL
jgi:hypothetical protein